MDENGFYLEGAPDEVDAAPTCQHPDCPRPAQYTDSVMFTHWCARHFQTAGSFPAERHRIVVRGSVPAALGDLDPGDATPADLARRCWARRDMCHPERDLLARAAWASMAWELNGFYGLAAVTTAVRLLMRAKEWDEAAQTIQDAADRASAREATPEATREAALAVDTPGGILAWRQGALWATQLATRITNQAPSPWAPASVI